MLSRSLVLVALLGITAGCADDGPSSGVRAATSESTPIVDEAVVGEAAAGAAPVSGDGRPAAVDGAPVGEAATSEVAPANGEPPEVDEFGLPRSVAVVGDSLTLSAEAEIETALGLLGVEVITIDAIENRRMAQGDRSLPPGTDAIDAITDAGVVPDLWVIALGTNDVGAQASTVTFGNDMGAVLRRIPGGTPVVWVDVWVRDRADDADDANDVIRSTLAMRPRSHVVDWHAHAGQPNVIISDGVHLTELGRQRFAAAMARGIFELTTG